MAGCINGVEPSATGDLIKLKMSQAVELSIASTNALDKFEEVQNAISNKQLIIFLDYDGTLTPIVSDPDQAIISDENREILTSVKETFTTNIVSGRAVDKVSGFLNLEGLLFAGSHGFDIRGSSRGQDVKYEVAAEYLPSLGTLRDVMKEKLSHVEGAYVEDNVYSVTIHYRNCDAQHVPEMKRILDAEKEAYENIVITEGKKVFELRPNFVWHKGEAVKWILESQNFTGEEFCAIYIGDDKTDEDAFKVLQEYPHLDGIGILVSEENRDSFATFSLRNPTEVGTFLSRLVSEAARLRAPSDTCRTTQQDMGISGASEEKSCSG
mmetsp:Transcript_1834/g.2506  ORF Transcript_1834/g.2506 Transcript_1834/m.2506 type:complete len:324 (+) Transcript_1834:243-1214(+)